jgi:hypothetical protein
MFPDIRVDPVAHVPALFAFDIVDREKPTIRQLVQRLADARGHWVIAEPPEKIADTIQT